MKKTLERLRRMKGEVIDRMDALTNAAMKDNRDLTAAEQEEYSKRKTEAEELAAEIKELEEKLSAGAAPPAAVSAQSALNGEQAVAAERNRVASIDAAAESFLRRGEITPELVERHKRDGSTVETFKGAIIEQLAARTNATPISGAHGGGLQPGRDAVEKRREAMSLALMNRHDGSVKIEGLAREYRGMSLLRMAEESLMAAGVKTRGMSPLEMATESMAFGQQFVGVGAPGVERLGAMGTSDFPYVLANVANKTLRRAYEAETSRWREFCRQSNSRDFKSKYVNQLGDAPALELVPENGEFKSGSIPEAQESYRIYTYGKILPFTRQALINDDLSAFTRTQELQGRAAARKEADIVWALITSNPTMGDGVALFHASAVPTGHGNLISSGTAINVDNLGVARQKMRIQKGLNQNEYLNLTPKFLLVPTAKEQLSIQYTSTAFQAMATSSTATGINPWAGTLTPIAEARLDANSATAWYMVADPGMVDTIEYAYLEGQEGVYLETRMGFNVDGMEFKCRIDFGAKVIDWRAFVKNVGA